ncbi:palmitoleoyl-protein carboxylesterase notum1 [Pelomyxa schiedti]|nr:palmitoleoyl-protein carboxylesterase notum1 [Pelomyxa schiedti]
MQLRVALVYVNYCSSDAHTGDRGVTSPSSPWYFRGKRIVAGVFQDLSETTEFSKATSVVFSGCSAGARGVLANVDLVANLVSQYAPQATFRAFSDAGWWYDRDPLYPTIVSLREQTQLGVAYFNGTADQDCMSTMSESDKWQCFFAMYAWPYISTPIFWQVEQYDSWQLGWNGVSIPLDTLREKDYVYSFAHYVKSTTRDIANNMPQDGVFSPGCWDHCMSESDQYYRVHVTNPITAELATLKDTLHWWLGNEPPSFIDVVESCLDFNCSVNCLAS